MISRQRATTSEVPQPASAVQRHNQRSATTSVASQPAQRQNQRSVKTSFWHTFC